MSTDAPKNGSISMRELEFENACLAFAHAVSASDRACEALTAATLEVRRIERAINDQRTAPAPLDAIEATHIREYLNDLEAELVDARELGRVEQIRLYESERVVEEYRQELEERSAVLASVDPQHAEWRAHRDQLTTNSIPHSPLTRRG